ncbi:MAG TPA: prolyl oligopeptidase family serine peptidase [Vicinamibacterales bacterium]|nr:prolyl oligopeptidase family serine peptidase [Vicinamibacterales bacterium]
MPSYGAWPSPLTAARVTAGALRLDQIQLDGDDVYWLEGRASEGGRNVIVRVSSALWSASAPPALRRIEPVDITPAEFNVRTRVHEYGGAAYTVHKGAIYFSNFSDQRVYRQAPGEAPVAMTEPGPMWADYRVDSARHRLIGVREHNGVNVIAAIPDRVLLEGADFYSDPIVSPDGKFLAWLQWNHPNMPWDGTELWVAAFNASGLLGLREKVAGGNSESIFQPEWSPDGVLYFVSDRTGWWNLYRWRGTGVEPVYLMDAEFGKPQWTFSTVTYTFAALDRIAATYVKDGRWKLALIDTDTKKCQAIDVAIQPLESIKANLKTGDIYFVGGSATAPPAIVRVFSPSKSGRHQLQVLRSSTTEPFPFEWISVAEAVTFTVKDREVHAFYYPPTNPYVEVPPDERPPLIVITHGGPTGATSDVLDPKIQFWTSRGFAVLDVDYSGSTGYGRPYRDRLKGQWGIVDVEDAVGGAEAMVAMGKADPNRLIIRGGSAGGYTTLAALTFFNTFKAGASYYGISDLEVLQHDTHKFEARYNDTLIGPWPAAKAVYKARSPIHFTDRLSCPIILFQGLEDKVVPPNQSEMMAEAARKKGLKVKYVAFEGEQHGFRKADTIIRSLEEELAFYQDVFAIRP